MTEDNDLLLQQFFSDAAQQAIDDDGFTERVMAQLPKQRAFNVKLFNRLWTLSCVVLFAVFFVVLHGWELLAVELEVFLRTLSVQSFTINPLMLGTVLFGLLFVGVGETISWETSHR